MPHPARSLTREFGTVFAVLAIYVVTLLAPLHHAAGLQRDFAALGYETYGGWSVCAQLSQEGDTKPVEIVQAKCPASGIGKNELAGILPTPFTFAPVLATASTLLPSVGHDLRLRMGEQARQPRAPPHVA